MATRNAQDIYAVYITCYGSSFVTRPTRLAKLRGMPRTMIINRGKNTGVGDAYVYWSSPNSVDTVGIYYNCIVPWVQITDVVGVGTYNAL
jgi:hypothetical protein